MNPEKCLICGSDNCKRISIKIENGIIKKWRYICKYCGSYEIDDDKGKFLLNILKDINLWESDNHFGYEFLEKINNNLYKLQSYIREQNDAVSYTHLTLPTIA
jgi:hypothetical protein